jgi:hypothetical protein
VTDKYEVKNKSDFSNKTVCNTNVNKQDRKQQFNTETAAHAGEIAKKG